MVSAPQKKQSQKGQFRAESLMEAAIDLFMERDYASVTIQDITRRAGVTHSLVYYHFKNKEELFGLAVTNLIEKTIKAYKVSRKDHSDPVELIEDWFKNNIRLSNDLRKLVKFMFDYSATREDTPAVKQAIRKFYKEEHQILASNIEKGISNGCFAQVNPQQVATFVSTHIDGIFYRSFIQGSEDIEPAMKDLKWVLWNALGFDESKWAEGNKERSTVSDQ